MNDQEIERLTKERDDALAKLRREVIANHDAQTKCAEKDATLNGLSKSVTELSLAIDPTSTHGPETEKIVAYLKETLMEKDAKIAALWVYLTQSKCQCYHLNGGGITEPVSVKCPKCEALENFPDLGKGWKSPEEYAVLKDALQRIGEYWNKSSESAVDAAEECRAFALEALTKGAVK